MIVSSGYFKPKSFEVLSLDDPIHISSVLDELITSPDKFLNTSRRLKRASAESIGTLRSNDADDNEDVKKTIGLISKTTTSHVHHTFLYISFPFLHDDVKMPNFAFYGGRKQATTKFISLSKLEYVP